MRPSHTGHTDTRPKAVLAAQALIWVQFAAIAALYGLGATFLLAATMSASSVETPLEVVNGGGAERWILALTAVAVTASLPPIAVRLGSRRPGAVRAAWYALAFVPGGMYVWIVARAYLATLPDHPEFFLSAGAMLVVCGSLPAVTLLCLSSRSARAWFAPAPAAVPRARRAEAAALVAAE
ncbi:hypothetical protein [Glycomyces xiaoerkulensis]|uniref:hypothetical protein n=1 Tax=Glycomyces xiaoerkulensis TaxID=2038139 RepID=UPI000C267AEA|nr:hypothetical protein [Glycomyces xiaoerkulensis]